MTADGWPWPGDSQLTKTRRVAQAYRAALGACDPELQRVVDERMAAYGQTWVSETELQVDTDGMDALTTAEAAQLVHVAAYEIRRWATMRHPEHPDRMLLPRFRRRGREMTYLAAHVIDAARCVRGPVGLPRFTL